MKKAHICYSLVFIFIVTIIFKPLTHAQDLVEEQAAVFSAVENEPEYTGIEIVSEEENSKVQGKEADRGVSSLIEESSGNPDGTEIVEAGDSGMGVSQPSEGQATTENGESGVAQDAVFIEESSEDAGLSLEEESPKKVHGMKTEGEDFLETIDSIPMPPSATMTYYYIDETGTTQTQAGTTDIADTKDIADTTTTLGIIGETTWYSVAGDVENDTRLVVSGDVRLILVDGCTFTAKAGITVLSGDSLTIYAGNTIGDTIQGTGVLKIGAPVSDSTGDSSQELRMPQTVAPYQAGIGGDASSASTSADGGTVRIFGGNTTVFGGAASAGIGGGGGPGGSGKSGCIIISGDANVTAIGGNTSSNGAVYHGGAGIGSGGTQENGAIGTIDQVYIDTSGVVEAIGGSTAANVGMGSNGTTGAAGSDSGKPSLPTAPNDLLWSTESAMGPGYQPYLYGSNENKQQLSGEDGDDVVNITWNPPWQTGAPITGYVILTYGSSEDDSATLVDTIAINGRSGNYLVLPGGNLNQIQAQIGGLEDSLPYTFHVFPVNEAMDATAITAGSEKDFAYSIYRKPAEPASDEDENIDEIENIEDGDGFDLMPEEEEEDSQATIAESPAPMSQAISPQAASLSPVQVSVSVPVKMIWAAMYSDGGAVYSPEYQILNNGSTAVTVSLSSYTFTNATTLNFTENPTSDGDIGLTMTGTSATPDFGLDDYYLDSDSSGQAVDLAIGTLGPAGEGEEAGSYQWSGSYVGGFSSAQYPAYNMAFQFSAVKGPWRIVQIENGYYHSIALDSDGAVWTWGYNNVGQRGIGNTTVGAAIAVPTQIDQSFFGNLPVVSVATGEYTCYAVNSAGQAYAWGDAVDGALGTGSLTDVSRPVMVTMPPGITFTQISAMFQNAAALGSDGNVYTWGPANYGANGTGETTNQLTPLAITNTGDLVQVSQGYYGGAAVTNTGRVYVWGSNSAYGLGIGTEKSGGVPAGYYQMATLNPTLSNIVSVSYGQASAFALDGNGNVYTWGASGGYGAGTLGLGTAVTQAIIPTQIPSLSGVSQINAGFYTTQFLKGNDLYTCGLSNFGILFDGVSGDYKYVPTKSTMANVDGNVSLMSGYIVNAFIVSADGTTIYGVGYGAPEGQEFGNPNFTATTYTSVVPWSFDPDNIK